MPEASTISGDGPGTAADTSERRADRRMLIDGQLVETPQTFSSLNPATGEVLGHAPDATVADAEAAVAAARRAFDTTDWSTNTELRVRCLEQLHQALIDHRDELAELTIAEVGATPALCQGAQLDSPIAIVRYYADLLKSYPMTEDLGNIESRGMQHHRWVEKEAAGVVAAIIAYNYPNQLALAKLAPALAAGCTVVLKGAPDTPLVSLALGELIANHTDIPAGVVNVLSGADPEVGAVLTTSPDVDMVTFTGSTPTGRRIMAAASETLQEGLPRTRWEVGRDRARRRRLQHRGVVHRVRDGEPRRSGLCTHVANAGAQEAQRRDRRAGQEQLRSGPPRRPDRPEHLHGSTDQ